MEQLLIDIRACQLCEGLPLGPRPILQASAHARILIAGQAPGRVTHAKGLPFDDVSGDRLRQWLGVTREQFYDDQIFAIVPMGFCFPGTAKGGDLGPRPLCAQYWREKVISRLTNVKLTLVFGKFAMDWHVPGTRVNLTEVVRSYKPTDMTVVLPHPSPRNGMWLKKNAWFETEVLPDIKRRVAEAL